MEGLRISVIIPVYNREETVPAAILSVLHQTYPVHEVIVVDDGSTDQTAAFVRAIPDERIRYLYQQNGGAGSARNLGIRCATGDWLAFLDSDDLWDKDKLETQAALVLKHPGIDFVHTNRRQRWPDGTETAGREGVGACDLTDKTCLLQEWVIKTSTVMLKRKLLNMIGEPFMQDRRTCEDYEVWWRAVILADQIGYVEQPVVTVMLGADGISRGGARSRYIEDNIYAMSRVIEWCTRVPKAAPYAMDLWRWRVSEYSRLFLSRIRERRFAFLFGDLIRCGRSGSILCLATASAMALRTVCADALRRASSAGTR